MKHYLIHKRTHRVIQIFRDGDEDLAAMAATRIFMNGNCVHEVISETERVRRGILPFTTEPEIGEQDNA